MNVNIKFTFPLLNRGPFSIFTHYHSPGQAKNSATKVFPTVFCDLVKIEGAGKETSKIYGKSKRDLIGKTIQVKN